MKAGLAVAVVSHVFCSLGHDIQDANVPAASINNVAPPPALATSIMTGWSTGSGVWLDDEGGATVRGGCHGNNSFSKGPSHRFLVAKKLLCCSD